MFSFRSASLVCLLLVCCCFGQALANSPLPAADTLVVGLQPKDPTQPPTAQRPRAPSSNPAAAPKLKLPVLSSILTSNERKLAVINGKLVREGDLVAGMRVVQVAKDEVQLKSSKQARALVLRLPKSNIGKDYR